MVGIGCIIDSFNRQKLIVINGDIFHNYIELGLLTCRKKWYVTIFIVLIIVTSKFIRILLYEK